MTTRIEEFLRDPSADRLIEMLSTFLAAPGHETAVRATALALTPKSRNGRDWRSMTNQFRRLFPPKTYEIGDEDIRRYIEGLNYPRRKTLKSRLALLCIHMVEANPVLLENDPFANDAFLVNDVFSRVKSFTETKSSSSFATPQSGDLFNTINRIFNALQLTPDNGKIRQLLFGALGPQEDRTFADTSYYAVYRHSTGKGRIVRTLLALKSPAEGQVNCFSFTHVYNSGRRPQKRITRGPVLSFEHCAYFAGLTSAEVGRGSIPGRGVELIAFPGLSGLANPDHKLLRGLCLSHGVGWQPIVGRLAMIHLGFRSELERVVNDVSVAVRAIGTTSELVADLEGLDRDFQISDKVGLPIADIRAYILEHINNVSRDDKPPGTDTLFRALTIEDRRS